jgi:hypothetical protein
MSNGDSITGSTDLHSMDLLLGIKKANLPKHHTFPRIPEPHIISSWLVTDSNNVNGWLAEKGYDFRCPGCFLVVSRSDNHA